MKIKIVLVGLAIGLGFWIASSIYSPTMSGMIGMGLGALVACVLWGSEIGIEDFTPRAALGGAIGAIAASLAFMTFREAIKMLGLPYGADTYLSLGAFISFFYVGIRVGIRKGWELEGSGRRLPNSRDFQRGPKILDTSVIIDGRIADVAETGFTDGIFIVPKFIMKELQYIADSNDPVKRVRGRRGLDVLKRMQGIPNVSVKITGHDFPKVKEADLKLVELAKRLKGTVITNDFNLNKVAGLQGVKVLNLNQLASALKPVVLPGETMNIRVIREGREENQGVGYLEDGTMVVVDEAKRHIGQEIEVAVTSVLQTPTGRIIFSKVKEEGQKEAASI